METKEILINIDDMNSDQYKIILTKSQYHVNFVLMANVNNVWQLEANGDFKHDGCFNFMTNPECMMHVCYKESFKIFEIIYDRCKEFGGW